MPARDEDVRAASQEQHKAVEHPPPVLDGNYVFPASTGQKRLWFLREFDERWGVAYHLPVAFRLEGPVNRVILQRAVNHVVGRHESLRTRLAYVDGQLSQVINPGAYVTVSFVDLGPVQEPERWDEARRWLSTETQRPFRFTESSLLRVTLLRLTDEQHVLLVTVHHTVADGRSLEVFIGELAACYDAFVRGAEPQLPEVPLQYVDFSAWQQQHVGSEAYEKQRAYWRKKLSGAPLVLELPIDRTRPSVQTLLGATKQFSLPAEFSAAVHQRARETGTTAYMVLLAAFEVLLHRYTGYEDFLIGTPVANRQSPELESMVGFLVNTLALRADLSGDPSVSELLRRIRNTVQEALTYQEFPFESVVEELHPERTLSRNPIFQVMFGFQQAPHAQLKLGPLKLSRLPVEYGTSKFDLSFFLFDDGHTIEGVIEYSTELFEAGTIDRLIRHYTVVLEGIIRNAAQPVSQLALLTGAERAEMLARAFHAEPAPEPSLLLPQIFEAQVSRTPDQIALSFRDERLTYRELNSRANRLAHLLRARGIRPEDRVAICLERSTDLLIALLGVLKAGAAYVPVDVAYPPGRVSYMLQDAQPAAMITHREFAHLGEGVPHVIELDRVDLSGQSEQNPGQASVAENLAYILYTSGSTGRPKGVMVTHGALANFLRSMALEPGLKSGDVLAAVTTISFDIAGLELYLPLVTGARVLLVTREQASDGRALSALLKEHQVTVMQATPATWRMMTDTGWQPGPGFTVLCGGEALAQDLAHTLTANGAKVWNLYGPTETTIWSCRKLLKPGAQVTLGRALGNTSVYVLDRAFQPVPVGVCGELFIGGAGVARGYRGRPDLTTERFVPDPFAGQPTARLYRTGDLVRLRADGDLEFVGRADHQVKVRGFRIELGEIDAVLRSHEAIRDVATIVWGSSDAERRLVAYVVPSAPLPQEQLIQRLREHARASLPDYMVPSSIVPLEAIPLTPNLKVDRAALPDPRTASVQVSSEYVAPRTETEARVASIWARLLSCERVGVHDNFFELGGNSLLAGQLIQELDRAFGVHVPMREIFIDATVVNLATVVEAGLKQSSQTEDHQLNTLLDKLSDEEVEALLNDPMLKYLKEEKR